MTIQAGNIDEYAAEISDLRAELSSLHGQLRASHTQLTDNGGALRVTQEQLAESHGALSIERQKTMELAREIRALSRVPSPLPGAISNAAIAFDSQELTTRSRSWNDKEGSGSHAALSNVGPSAADRSSTTVQVTAEADYCPCAEL